VLFTASTRSRQEVEALAAEARRLRPDVEIFILSAGRCGLPCRTAKERSASAGTRSRAGTAARGPPMNPEAPRRQSELPAPVVARWFR